jgi:microcystin-dependent protein
VFQFAGTTAPSLHQLCYGQTIGDVGSGADVENAGYATVFDIVKNAYGNAGTEVFGSGDTVLMPDCRGRVAAGQDDMGGSSADRLTGASGGVDGDVLGDTGGAETHSLTSSENGPHNHTVTISSSAAGTGTIVQGSGSLTSISTTSSGSGSAHNNVQPTIIFNTIMFMGA